VIPGLPPKNRKENSVRRILTSLALAAAVAVLTTACSQKGPAEEALKAADAAVAAAKANVEKYVPDQWNGLNDALKGAKDAFAKGDYAAALAAAQAIPGKATAAINAAKAKKDEYTKEWADISASVPAAVKAAEEKVAALAAMKKLPKGMDAAKLDAAKAGAADLKKMWDDAVAVGANDPKAAVEKAKEIKAKADELVKTLTAEAAPAPAAKAPAKAHAKAPAKKKA
jgi:predicted small lipoprotein YifL